MKTVCKKVYETYPDFDLTHKKDFIKSTVKTVSGTLYSSICYFKIILLHIQGACSKIFGK